MRGVACAAVSHAAVFEGILVFKDAYLTKKQTNFEKIMQTRWCIGAWQVNCMKERGYLNGE